MRSYTDVHLSLTPAPVEGDRCGHCDRVFELGDVIVSRPVPQGARPDHALPRWVHMHEGCALFHASHAPAVSENAGRDQSDRDTKATAA